MNQSGHLKRQSMFLASSFPSFKYCKTRVTSSSVSCCLFRPSMVKTKRAAAASIIFERRTCATERTNRPFWGVTRTNEEFHFHFPLCLTMKFGHALYLECHVSQSVESLLRLTMKKEFQDLGSQEKEIQGRLLFCSRDNL